MRRFFARLTGLFRGEREMAREMESHLALLREDFERRGMSPHEAALAARRAYGGVELSKDLHRDARSLVWVEQLLKDVRYAARNLMRSPGFTVVAALALALGIGVNATVFALYNAAALKQLPVAHPDRVVRIERWSPYFGSYNFAYIEYQFLRDRTSAFSGVTAASSEIPVLATLPGSAARQHLTGYAVSANYFADLGVEARLGRTFLPEEDRAPGASPVVVLSYRFWQQKFQSNQNAIGQTIELNRDRYTIVGIAPPEFTGTDVLPTEANFWAPLSALDQLDPEFGPATESNWRAQWRDSSYPGFQLLARLKPGVTRRQAQAETDVILRQYLAGHRESARTVAVTLPGVSYLGTADEPWFRAFAAAVLLIVSLVLLVACANVANMLLARGAGRQREIGIRLALGAGRGRVVRQLLTESILLSLLGGAAGILFSVWAGRLLWVSLIGFVQGFRNFRIDLDVSPDAHVLIYGLAVSVLTGLVFGLAPALQATRKDLHSAVTQEGLGWRHGRSRLRGWLLGAQVTVSVLLLVVGGGMMGSLTSSFAKATDLGYETRDTYRVRVAWKGSTDILRRIRTRLETLPELSRVAIGGAPLQETIPLTVTAGNWNGPAQTSFASDGYFETLGIRLLRGRSFTRQETDGGAPVAVISESAERRLWPGQSPLGRHVTLGGPIPIHQFTDYEVIGVAKDVRFATIKEMDPLHVYLPAGDARRLLGGLIVRTRAGRDQAVAAVQSAVEAVDPALAPGMEMVSLEEGTVALQRGAYRVSAAFAGTLALLSLTLAGIGVYGVMAFLVSRRTREIGIRMALGASSGTVIRSVVIRGLGPVLGGTLAGVAAAAALRIAARAVGLVGPADPANPLQPSFSGVALLAELAVVVAIAVVASIIPARRASRVDPAVALRHE